MIWSVRARRPFPLAFLPLAIVTILAMACGSDSPTQPTGTVDKIDLLVGSGIEATTGRTVAVHYTGWLADDSRPDRKGTQFDSSVGKQPFSFRLGARQVIAGWDQGIPGMKIGGQRRLIVPPDLAYGSAGSSGVIPPNATLIFDVELLAVQ